MNRIVLSKARKKMVREWLDYRNPSTCPFKDWPTPHEICSSWFLKVNVIVNCPCQTYTLSTVRRKAREMIRFNGVKEGGKK